MQPRSGLITVALALLAGILVLLLFQSFQLSNLEERLILQARQLQALGDSSDRLGARVDALAQGGGVVRGEIVQRDPYADIEVLFPDRPNLLEPAGFSISNPDVPLDQTLVRGWPSGDPNSFNPLSQNAAEVAYNIEYYVLEALARRSRWTDPDRFARELAWRVSVSDDYREFLIYLRRGVQWHDPGGVDLSDPRFAWLREDHELTARDVKFTFELATNPQVESTWKSFFLGLESVEVLDDYTVRVRWKESLYTNFLTTVGFPILPEFLWAYDEHGERFPDETLGVRVNQHWYGHRGTVGTGPYRMMEYEPGAQIRLERNEDYWGPKPPIKRIHYPIYTDPNRTLLMLKAHEVDAGGLRASEYRDEVLKWQDVPEESWPDSPFLNGVIECKRLRRFAYSFIGWNADKPLFADAVVRTAMTRAFNRQQIIDDIYLGLGEVAVGPFNADTPFNDRDVPDLPFDLAAAAALLAEAGWTDSNADGLVDKDLDGDGTREPFEFTLLLYANSPEYTALANVFKEDLLEIGIRMKIDAVEWSLMQKRMDEKQFDAYTGGWATGWESDPYQIWHSSQADVPKGSNRVGFRDGEVDRLILELRATFDRDGRVSRYREIHRRIYAEQPYTFFRIPHGIYCWWSNVKGVRFPKVAPQIDSGPWWIEPG